MPAVPVSSSGASWKRSKASASLSSACSTALHSAGRACTGCAEGQGRARGGERRQQHQAHARPELHPSAAPTPCHNPTTRHSCACLVGQPPPQPMQHRSRQCNARHHSAHSVSHLEELRREQQAPARKVGRRLLGQLQHALGKCSSPLAAGVRLEGLCRRTGGGSRGGERVQQRDAGMGWMRERGWHRVRGEQQGAGMCTGDGGGRMSVMMQMWMWMCRHVSARLAGLWEPRSRISTRAPGWGSAVACCGS